MSENLYMLSLHAQILSQQNLQEICKKVYHSSQNCAALSLCYGLFFGGECCNHDLRCTTHCFSKKTYSSFCRAGWSRADFLQSFMPDIFHQLYNVITKKWVVKTSLIQNVHVHDIITHLHSICKEVHFVSRGFGKCSAELLYTNWRRSAVSTPGVFCFASVWVHVLFACCFWFSIFPAIWFVKTVSLLCLLSLCRGLLDQGFFFRDFNVYHCFYTKSLWFHSDWNWNLTDLLRINNIVSYVMKWNVNNGFLAYSCELPCYFALQSRGRSA